MSIVLSILLLISFCIEPAYVISITDDQTATNGSTVTIECTAGGTPSVFTYEWMKNGVTIVGETGSSLTISSVTSSDIGEYKCTPSNSFGSTNSSSSILSVNGKFTNTLTPFNNLCCCFLTFFSFSCNQWIISTNNFWSSS